MPSVAIVGGGLAGLTAALRLAERGYTVTVYEGSARLGGKVGADKHGSDYDEHGYHIFPEWYLNVWGLIDELGIRGNFKDLTEFKQLRRGDKHYTTLTNITALRHIPSNLFSGVFSLPQMILFFYAALDLVCQPYSYRAFLDQITVNGFMRSRWYRTERIALVFQDLMLKGISCPSYQVSAMTMRNVLRYWARHPLPMHRILNGDLQQLFIDPLRQRLQALGVTFRLRHTLQRINVEHGKVVALTFEAEDGQALVPVERMILAIPVEKVVRLIDGALFAAAPSLDRLSHLHARPMSALNLYFKRKIANIPPEHVNLVGSKYAQSFIDVGPHWQGYTTTVLNLIASDANALQTLSEAACVRELFEDLRQYYPDMRWEDVEKYDFQPHFEQPLFMNEAGAWHFRPDMLRQDEPLRKELPTLYLAGDYCRSHVDLVSMEGAVTTGLRAAEALRRDVGMGGEVKLLTVEKPPIALYWVIRFLLIPFIALVRLLVRDR
jgi:uncharacterized protein with NAD-binding domain and iron-sulfur cluster